MSAVPASTQHPHTNLKLFFKIQKPTLVLVIRSLTYDPLLLGTQRALVEALGPQRCPTRGTAGSVPCVGTMISF